MCGCECGCEHCGMCRCELWVIFRAGRSSFTQLPAEGLQIYSNKIGLLQNKI